MAFCFAFIFTYIDIQMIFGFETEEVTALKRAVMVFEKDYFLLATMSFITNDAWLKASAILP